MPTVGDTATAVEAAVRVATLHGVRASEAIVIAETNNVVVWLAPDDVIAKVGRWPHSVEALAREHAAAVHLAKEGAPIGAPVDGIDPTIDETTGCIVTLWHRIDDATDHDVAPDDAARSLRVLHAYLARYEGPVPDVRRHIELARRALDDDAAMAALPASGRETLRRAIDRLSGRMGSLGYRPRILHGEPHLGNVLRSTDGPRWIDLEDVCVGPLEWDVAFLPQEAERMFTVDAELMDLMRILNSACVATWCWVRADVDGMLPHARHHLDRVRAAFPA